MLGAAIAERTGLFAAAMRGALGSAPKSLLTPFVVFCGMVANHASDAAYVVFIPLAGLVYASMGHHPVAGIAAAFAGVSDGFSGNIFAGQLDVLLLGITEPAARLVDPTWTMNPLGNWWYMFGMVVLFTPIAWFITDRIIEPRLGAWTPPPGAPVSAELEQSALGSVKKRGPAAAGLVTLAVIAGFAALALWPGFTPLIDESKEGPEQLTPFYRALVGGFMLVFLAAGWTYGAIVGTVRGHRDIVAMMGEGMKTLAPYLVLAFFAAHFVEMFKWSNLGPILAVQGAAALREVDMPAPLLLASVVAMSSGLDLFIGSASAKWSVMAPVVVPMFMLLGVSPEMTTAAYRMGDSVTNIIMPLMSYFPLILAFAQRWDPRFGIGSLTATMLRYSLSFLVAGLAMTAAWVYFDIPVGPGAPVTYEVLALSK
jgi:aminobenzoyl-glutamate transport protein